MGSNGELDADVTVVGAGPVGLLLAGDLSSLGVRVLVLEQRAEPTDESRASILHARTMELFGDRGLLEEFGPLAPAGSGHFGGLRFDFAAADAGHPHAGQWECLQSRTERVLQDRAVRLGALLLRGHAVTGLAQRADHVELAVTGTGGVPRRYAAGYVVGCDGEHSTVRQLAGFGFPGQDATREMLRADMAGLDLRQRKLERTGTGIATSVRRADGTTRLMVHAFGAPPARADCPPDHSEIVEAWARVTGEDIAHGAPTWLNRFGDVSRQADRYRDGRVLLAGDAAHAQMPIGGQALNLGLQDAMNLGWKLAALVRGRAGDELLDRYHDERHAAGRRALANIRAQAGLLFGGPEVEALRSTFAGLLGHERVRGHLARMISGTDVREPAAPPSLRPGPGATTANRSEPTPKDTTMNRLNDKTALVTGSSRGIGRATALRLAREGALVAVHYATNEEAAQETISLIEGDGGRAFPVRAELGAPGDVHELFLALERGLKERTGETSLDILVNNAGSTASSGTAPEDVTPEQFDRYFAVNAKAPYFIVQRAIQLMPDGGRIINISSGLTRFANPEQVAYAMTKGAVEQISLHFARYLAPRGITVNSVAPGITNNGGAVFDIPEAVEQMAQLSAFKRVGQAGDVADVVTFLATDEARWITGSFVDASGGTLLG